jgi:MATE family multidrug resistance protein
MSGQNIKSGTGYAKIGHAKIWAIAGPAILANSSAPLVGLVDTWAIGHLAGAENLAAVGLGGTIFTYVLWAFGFLRMGTTGLVAQAKGRLGDRGDKAELVTLVLQSTALAIGFSLLIVGMQGVVWDVSMMALAPPDDVSVITREYFDIRIWAAPASLFFYTVNGVLIGLARAKAALVLQVVLNLLNGGLNVLFVVGMDMGVSGVALGTVIAEWVTALLGAYLILKYVGGVSVLWAGVKDKATWGLAAFKRLMVVNGFIFVRTLFLMTALAMIMRTAGQMDPVAMAASHVLTQYMLLMSLGLDGFAYAAEALAGAAYGKRNRQEFRHWVVGTSKWAIFCSLFYAGLFWFGGNALTAILTDIGEVKDTVAGLIPLMAIMPIVAVWSYQFDGIYIGATAAGAMATTMGLAFAIYMAVLPTMVDQWGLFGLWGAVIVFMGVRGITQALWYPRIGAKLD